jgi:hypothetical protein
MTVWIAQTREPGNHWKGFPQALPSYEKTDPDYWYSLFNDLYFHQLEAQAMVIQHHPRRKKDEDPRDGISARADALLQRLLRKRTDN